jgi:hypothetical protein
VRDEEAAAFHRTAQNLFNGAARFGFDAGKLAASRQFANRAHDGKGFQIARAHPD